jgi:hypothetical protein
VIATCLAATAAFAFSPACSSLQFVSTNSQTGALAAVRPWGPSAMSEAEAVLDRLRRIKALCEKEGWSLKTKATRGIRAADGSVFEVPPGAENVAFITVTLDFVEKGQRFRTMHLYMTYVMERENRWRLIDIESDTPASSQMPTPPLG